MKKRKKKPLPSELQRIAEVEMTPEKIDKLIKNFRFTFGKISDRRIK